MNIPFTKRARKLLGLAADRAKALSSNNAPQPVDVDHIVWAAKKFYQLERTERRAA